MSEEIKLEISGSCSFVITRYGPDVAPDLALDYTEHSQDHWHSDSDTSIDIDINKAYQIIEFIKKAYDI